MASGKWLFMNKGDKTSIRNSHGPRALYLCVSLREKHLYKVVSKMPPSCAHESWSLCLDSTATGTTWPTECRGSDVWAVQGQVLGRPGPWRPKAPRKEQPCAEALEKETPREERPRQGGALPVWLQSPLSPQDNCMRDPGETVEAPAGPWSHETQKKGCVLSPRVWGCFVTQH